jgi:hypothetical protein
MIHLLLATLFSVSLLAHANTAGTPVPHSPARDQKSIGFCWAYTLTGLIEGERLRSGATPAVHVSGEYIGFYHMYFQIKNHIGWFRKLAKRIKEGGLEHSDGSIEDVYERIYVRNHFFTPDEANEESRALIELGLVGVVPQNVYSETYNDDQDAALTARLKKFIKENLFDEAKLDVYDQGGADTINETLLKEFSAAFGSKPPRPTDTFTYRGQTYTPRQFLNQYLQFEPDDFVEITATKATHARDIGLVHELLQKGISVPIGFTIFKDKDSKGVAIDDNIVTTGVFTSAVCPNDHCTKEDTGHEVLAVNWLENAAGTLTGLIVKNSWGKTGFSDKGKNTATAGDKGFYIIDSDYLLNSITGSNDPWTFVVPVQFKP